MDQGTVIRAPQPEEMQSSFQVWANNLIALSPEQWDGATFSTPRA
jgi:hypothetical protein